MWGSIAAGLKFLAGLMDVTKWFQARQTKQDNIQEGRNDVIRTDAEARADVLQREADAAMLTPRDQATLRKKLRRHGF